MAASAVSLGICDACCGEALNLWRDPTTHRSLILCHHHSAKHDVQLTLDGWDHRVDTPVHT